MYMNRKLRVGINGFGRIGRAVCKVAWMRDDMEIVAVNDLGDIHNLAYLLQYDTVYKTAHFDVTAEIHENSEQYLLLSERGYEEKIKVFQVKNPNEIPWGTLDVDVVVESNPSVRRPVKTNVGVFAPIRTIVVALLQKILPAKPVFTSNGRAPL